MSDSNTPRNDAIRLLARREYSRTELLKRLAAKGHAADSIDEALAALADEGLQSDTRFAEVFVRSRIARGQGPIKIRAALGERGIDSDLIHTTLDDTQAHEADWFALACDALIKRFSTPADDLRERAQRERFLAGRGFDFDQVRYALEHAWDGHDSP